MINLVTISSQRYLVDVGMGARGPIVPLPLIHGSSRFSIRPRTSRLLYDWVPEHTSLHSTNRLWRLEVLDREGDKWTPTYAFSEVEFFPADYEVMNWYVTTHRRSWFTYQILVGRMILNEDQDEVIGDLTLFERTLKKRIHGENQMQIECRSEGDRVDLLERYFGLELTTPEQEGINGTMSAIL